jgi:hypothetical protein
MTVTITLTNSSHPDFQYFGDARVDGRQLSRRFILRLEMDVWVAQVRASALKHGHTVTVTDNAR